MNSELVIRSRLSDRQRSQMLRLLDRHFDGVTPRQFDADLDQKSHAILLTDADGKLLGFSTLGFETTRWQGEPINVVVSGDTIVDPVAWKSPALSRAWIESVLGLHRATDVDRLVWLLITSGFRTYRFLPVFWRRFYPRYDEPTPVEVKALTDALARRHYGERYDTRAGIVRFEQPQRLRNHLAGVPAKRLDDPHVAFFSRVNPNHAAGDELVSITEIREDNLTPAGRRMVRSASTLAPACVGTQS